MTQPDAIQSDKMPAPPEANLDSERLDVAYERWDACPLRDCKKDAALLYEDFHLRDVRTNRVMCSKCAVHTEVGYMAREIVEGDSAIDKPFDGTRLDYLLILFTTFIMSVGINSLLIYMHFVVIALPIGIAGGLLIGQTARRLTLTRVGRFSSWMAVIGILCGMIFAPVHFFMFWGLASMVQYSGFSPDLILGLSPILPGIVATVLMAFTAFLVFLKR